PRPGAPAARATALAWHHRQRRARTGQPLLRSRASTRAAVEFVHGGDARAHRSGRDRRCDARDAAGRAGGGIRLSRRDVRAAQLVAINVARFDAVKHGAEAIVADARVALQQLAEQLDGWRVPEDTTTHVTSLTHEWHGERDRVCYDRRATPAIQAGVIAAVNE